MPDIFDQVSSGTAQAPAQTGDIFDQVAQKSDPEADYNSFKEQYLANQNKGMGGRALDMVKGAAGGVKDFAIHALSAPLDIYHGLTQKAPDESAAQGVLEGSGRIGYDMLNAGRKMANQSPGDVATQALGGPILGPIAKAILPSSTDEASIRAAFDRQQTDKAYERQGDVVKPVYGKPNETLAKGVEEAPDAAALLQAGMSVASLVKTAIRPNVTTSLMNGMGKSLSTKDYLDLKKSVTKLDPIIDQTSKQLGIPWDTAQGGENLGRAAMSDIWQKRQALTGQMPDVSLQPIADAILKTADNPASKLLHGSQLDGLIEEAKKFAGQTVPAPVADEMLTRMNAKHSVYEAKNNVKKSVAVRSDPELEASVNGAKALRDTMNGLMDGYGELGQQYGAWRNFTDAAQAAAVKQAKLDGTLGLYEGLGYLQAVRQTGAPLKSAISIGTGKILKNFNTPDYHFSRAANAAKFSSMSPLQGTALKVMDKDGTAYMAQFQGKTADKIKVKMRDGKMRTFDPSQVESVPANRPPPVR